ncbi:hypothetical protein BJX63DRAFT_18767 [Aspergillus granulosus]|uniref:Uncharacterized protein n=1 Tax=Aspergillus granulosus TaxID=176169 RepID=A0ABR4GZY8_9EURO
MPRPIHLAVFSNGPRSALYSVFIPLPESEKKGKLIHVDGNPGYGFAHQFIRKFDLDAIPCPYQILPLGLVDDHLINDTDTPDPTTPPPPPLPGQEHFPFTQDAIPRDALENLATQVLPPARSENPFDPNAPNWQDWLGDYIRRLVEEGFLEREAITVFEKAPRVLDDERKDGLWH